MSAARHDAAGRVHDHARKGRGRSALSEGRGGAHHQGQHHDPRAQSTAHPPPPPTNRHTSSRRGKKLGRYWQGCTGSHHLKGGVWGGTHTRWAVCVPARAAPGPGFARLGRRAPPQPGDGARPKTEDSGGRMRFRTWPVAALALGALLLLVVVSVLEASRRAQEIYTRLDELNQRYHDVESRLRRLRSDVNLSGIFVRDYLLDLDRERAPEYRGRLAEFRRTTTTAPRGAARAAPGRTPDGAQFDSLQRQARRLLAGVRSAVRLDPVPRRRPEQRPLPAPRGRAAARGGPGDRAGDRRAQQRQPGDPARRESRAARPTLRDDLDRLLVGTACSAWSWR